MWYLSGEIKAVIPNKMLLTISHKKKKKKKNVSTRLWNEGMAVDGD